MTDVTVGLLSLAAMFVLMILRTPVGWSMMIVGFFGT